MLSPLSGGLLAVVTLGGCGGASSVGAAAGTSSAAVVRLLAHLWDAAWDTDRVRAGRRARHARQGARSVLVRASCRTLPGSCPLCRTAPQGRSGRSRTGRAAPLVASGRSPCSSISVPTALEIGGVPAARHPATVHGAPASLGPRWLEPPPIRSGSTCLPWRSRLKSTQPVRPVTLCMRCEIALRKVDGQESHSDFRRRQRLPPDVHAVLGRPVEERVQDVEGQVQMLHYAADLDLDLALVHPCANQCDAIGEAFAERLDQHRGDRAHVCSLDQTLPPSLCVQVLGIDSVFAVER